MAVDTGPAPPASHEHALNLLRARGIAAKEIIRVESDSVLYLNASGRAMTAWVACSATGRVTDVRYEPGFPAYPSPGLEPRTPLSRDAATQDMDGA